ncbi:hypothetical protein ABMA10_19515 [Plantibacter sp. RU18]
MRWLRAFLRQFASDGGTVLVTSHQLAEVARYADEAVIIHNGTVAGHHNLAQRGADELEALYLRAVQKHPSEQSDSHASE